MINWFSQKKDWIVSVEFAELAFFSMLAGVFIGLGSYANIKLGGVMGSLIFSLGLLSVIRFGLPLYTGIVSKKEYYERILVMFTILFFNFIGALLFALASSIGDVNSLDLIIAKISKSTLNVLFDSFVCGLCVSIAVKADSMIMTVLAVMAFVLCGAEHCVADVYYIGVSNIVNVSYLVPFLATVIFGNTLGGLIMLEVRSKSKKSLLEED